MIVTKTTIISIILSSYGILRSFAEDDQPQTSPLPQDTSDKKTSGSSTDSYTDSTENKTILQMLGTIKSANITFRLGEYEFNNMYLNGSEKKITYFVPTNEAWEHNLQSYYPKTYEMIMSKPSIVFPILERHLIISSTSYTKEKIAEEAKTKPIRLPSLRGVLEVQLKNDILLWGRENITIIQANIICSNGIIHLIDKVFIQPGDIPYKKFRTSSIPSVHNFISVLFTTFMYYINNSYNLI